MEAEGTSHLKPRLQKETRSEDLEQNCPRDEFLGHPTPLQLWSEVMGPLYSMPQVNSTQITNKHSSALKLFGDQSRQNFSEQTSLLTLDFSLVF